MGEAAESKKSRGRLRSWMGEKYSDHHHHGDGDGDEEEKTLELSLGLPGGGGGGGGGWRAACRDKGTKHPVAASAAAGDDDGGDSSSILSLGYSTLVSHSQGKANKGSPEEAHPPATGNNALASSNNGSQTRSPSTPVIGWPPVRTFRRNLATSSKASLELQQNEKKAAKVEVIQRAPFIKINMDGIPIGRKIDLNALDSYDKLSLAVDKLFRGLLAAQRGPLPAGAKGCPQEDAAISGLLDGTGEYTLVYEDYEGDRVLVGDVPWGMFVSSVKRLRVLKTSDLSSSLIASGRKRTAAEC
ncbi:auxin-responsive protein IAA7 isoform X2 [Oryza brachyantha]|uniref:Auxin-responsive protein n=1 Tax=Oryza brachyantha TaxID=4533 RepID=J3LB30_ORYBR|nr:auxin-responsive protein IAA7 isoform X2 [Oryza brachyantha]